jgi:hypothetical protein
MKQKIIFTCLIYFLFLSIDSKFTFSQYSFECGTDGSNESLENIDIDNYWGWFKPLRTDLSGVDPEPPPEAYFPVLVVFIQFADDPSLPHWTAHQPPDYKDNFIAQYKKYGDEWWNIYSESTEILSSYWLQASRGKLHVVGKAYYVELGNASEYATENDMNLAIWNNLKYQQNITDWRPFDKWKPVVDGSIQKFKYERDEFVDMIYKVHKIRRGPLTGTPGGYAHLTSLQSNITTVTIDEYNTKIKYGFTKESSGVTVAFSPNKNANLNVLIHEHGHCMYCPGHLAYSKVVAGPGSDGFISPYEMLMLGYMSTTDITFNNPTPYNLKDYSARDNSNGYILKVPIYNSYEYFLIVNRSNYCKWDKVMLGDTARIELFDIFSEHDKGIYIYHVKQNLAIPLGNVNWQDLECADGLWTHSFAGSTRMWAYDAGYCFDNGIWNVTKRNQVVYDNDIGIRENIDNIGDDKSCGRNYLMWATIGQPPQDPCLNGIERIWTNSEFYFSFNQEGGDRWDPWKIGYNEVFSPYSSPNTNTWMTNPTNQNSGIFIILRSKNENDKSININIYKVGINGMSEDAILAVTPPSRPMGIKIEEEYPPPPSSVCYPKIVWNHNREPDMINPNNGNKLTYKVFRAYTTNINSVPGNYLEIATVSFLLSENPYYVDNTINNYDCSMYDRPPYGIPFPVRYYVRAIDKDNDLSVPSDFVATLGITPGLGIEPSVGEGDRISLNNQIPIQFNLLQNFPNPFNPITNIHYDLPMDIFVSVKIFDILGREIKTLLNEYKNAGRYIVSFNGSEFASGVYFYKIQAGSFVQVKRMVLLK